MTVEDAVKKAEEMAGGYSVTAFDPSKTMRLNDKAAEDRMRFHQEIISLDSTVLAAKAAGIVWLETNKDVITHLCGGKFPDAGYMIYKDVRLCLPNTADDIARRENMTVNEKLFVNDGKTYLAKKD